MSGQTPADAPTAPPADAPAAPPADAPTAPPADAPTAPAADAPTAPGDAPGDAPPEQTEYNLDGPSAMAEAVRAAIRSTTTAGAAPPPPDVVAAARQRAEQMLGGLGQRDTEGLRDLQNTTLSMGLPAARAVFLQLVAASALRGAAKREAKREISEFSPVTEVGCMQVDFHDRTTGRGNVAYLLVGPCPRTHDLGAQLGKLQPRCAEAKWPEVQRHLGALVLIARSVYARLAAEHAALLERLAPARHAEFRTLRVDPANTTLYLDAAWPNRVGLFVKLGAEVDAADAAEKADAVDGAQK